MFRRLTNAAPALSLRHTRAGVLVHEKVIRDGVIPALKEAEAQVGAIDVRVSALEAVRARGFWGRLRWLLTGR
jgi:hypothetical protein